MSKAFLKSCIAILALSPIINAHAYFCQGRSWPFTGFYLGANGGYAWGHSNTKTTTPFVPASYFIDTDVNQINLAGNKDLDLNNFTGGMQAGYNYQNGWFLVGAETDFNSFISDSSHSRTVAYEGAPDSTFTLYTKTSTDWLYTLRPRIGYVRNCMLFYVTGGLAVVKLNTRNTFTDTYVLDDAPSNAYESVSLSKNKTGVIYGAGIEYAIRPNVTIKAEYLYANFKKISSDRTLSLSPAYLAESGPLQQNTFHHTANFHTNIFRIGVNYIFA